MKALSASFVLGKLSTGNANVAHNNREIIAGNVDVTRIADNIIYVQDDVRDVYDELFGNALEAYNAKQKQPCRRIHDYFEHVSEGQREEAYYELIVQFGDMKTAGVGSEYGELAKKMLDEYAKAFQERNPNLRVFSQNLHMDEASPHLHINFIPFYTEGRVKRQREGVAAARLRGVRFGRPIKSPPENFAELVRWWECGKIEIGEVLKQTGLKEATFYRRLREYRVSKGKR